MNFYQRHIGDYLKATSHLSLLEHGIYTRLLDVYYTREGAIPADQAARLVGARSKDEKAALDAILAEFFTLKDDGWHQSRCDRELVAYKESEEDREHRQANEAERMRRHRERRKEMFATLRERGVVPKWDASTEELQRLVNADVTHLQRVQVHDSNAPDTAIHKPIPNTQYPIPNTQEPVNLEKHSVAKATGEKPPANPAEVIFHYGTALLVNAGSTEKTARSFLGKLRKYHDDENIVNTLRECVRAKPLQPLEWLAAALPPPNMAHKSGMTKVGQQAAAAAQQWLEAQ